MNRTTSTLATLSADEKAIVLDQLLADRPDLRKLAETYAVSLLSDEDRSAVAGPMSKMPCRAWISRNSTAGPVPAGRGYVHPGEAADEILDEAFGPFLEDLERRAKLGMRSAAVEFAAGIVLGLYRCREGGIRNAAGVLPGLRRRARGRRGEPMRETRYRAAQRRTPRSPARMGHYAALTLRSQGSADIGGEEADPALLPCSGIVIIPGGCNAWSSSLIQSKSAANQEKHGIDFVEAPGLWLDPGTLRRLPGQWMSHGGW